MYCTVCKNWIGDCKCTEEDRDRRFREISDPGGFTAMRWCKGCDRHYSMCHCPEPEWVMRSNGEYLPMPEEYAA